MVFPLTPVEAAVVFSCFGAFWVFSSNKNRSKSFAVLKKNANMDTFPIRLRAADVVAALSSLFVSSDLSVRPSKEDDRTTNLAQAA